MARKLSPVASRPSIFKKTDQGVPELEKEADASKPKRIKRTFHIEPELVILLDEIQLQEFRATGQKPELSALVSEGIRLLGQSRQQNGRASEQAES